MTELQKLTGAAGMVIADVVQAYTGLNYTYLIPREDSVLTACTGTDKDGNTTNLLTGQNWDGTLKSTDNLIPPIGYKITAFTISSGSFQCF
jgi:hypothetical protein